MRILPSRTQHAFRTRVKVHLLQICNVFVLTVDKTLPPDMRQLVEEPLPNQMENEFVLNEGSPLHRFLQYANLVAIHPLLRILPNGLLGVLETQAEESIR